MKFLIASLLTVFVANADFDSGEDVWTDHQEASCDYVFDAIAELNIVLDQPMGCFDICDLMIDYDLGTDFDLACEAIQ